MDAATGGRTSAPTFEDGFGKRYELPSVGGPPLSVLALSNAFVALPDIASLLAAQLTRLASFQHAGFARARRVARVANSERGVALVSDHVRGERLATLLAASRRDGYRLDANGALWIVGELVSAVAALHEHVPGAFHGAIAAERLVVTPDGRLVIVEHALGPCVARLAWTREQYWRTLRVILPRGDQPFSQSTDVAQIGMLAVALLQGRPLGDPAAASAALQGLPPALESWLRRTLQPDQENGFGSAAVAQAALNGILPDADAVAGLSTVKDLFAAYADTRRHTEPVVPLARLEPAKPAASVAEATATPELPSEEPPVPIQPSEALAVASPRANVAAAEGATEPPSVPEPHSEPATDEPVSKRDLILARLRGVEWAPWKIAAAAAGLVLLATATTYAARHYLRGTTPPPRPQVETVQQLPPTMALPEPLPTAEPAELVAASPDPLQALIESSAPAATPAPPAGWIAVRAPHEVEVLEDGRVLGTSRAERISLAPGRHQIELVNASLGLRLGQDVRVIPGRIATVSVEWPDGTLALNALPWADVWVDGQRVGETPLANITVPVGPHEVVFRHPELGERRKDVIVTTTPQRLSVDLRSAQE